MRIVFTVQSRRKIACAVIAWVVPLVMAQVAAPSRTR
jgi:hypothetical protein